MIVLVYLGVVLAGGVGATLRFLVDGAVAKRVGSPFPLGTTAVNLSGALVLGLLAGLTVPTHLAVIIGTGAVGSYTTFSTWMLETQRLAEERQRWYAALNIALALLAGLAAAFLGQWLGGLG